MNEVVIEHVKVEDLPAAWRAKLPQTAAMHVTVRIDHESPVSTAPSGAFTTDDPAFGIWRDRGDVADVSAYVRKLRSPRYGRDGARGQP